MTRFPAALFAMLLVLSSCVGRQASTQAPTKTADSLAAHQEPEPDYKSEDAQAELEFATEPSRRIRVQHKSTQRKSMQLHGARAQPCMFDDCSISDEDDPLR